MEQARRRPRQSLLAPALAAAVLLLGLLMMSGALTRSRRLLADSEDARLMKAARSVDNSIAGRFAWYCSDLEYITHRRELLAAEERWLGGGDAGELLGLLRESPLSAGGVAEAMLVLRGGTVELSTGAHTGYTFLESAGRIGDVDVSLCTDGENRLCVALVRDRGAVGYAALIDGTAFFAAAEQQDAAGDGDRVLLLDAGGRYLFCLDQEGVRVEAVDGLDPDLRGDLRIMLDAQRSGQPTAGFFPGGRPGEKSYTARLAVLPASGNGNGCFTVGVARNYDESVRPFQSAAEQMVLCAVVIMAGAVLLPLFLVRSGRGRQEARNEAVLLRARTEAMEDLNAQTQALAHRQRLETIGTLASGIAHEFNNLLTPIMGYSILILENLPPEDTESYDNALEIYNASQKAKRIIARLSNLSRKGGADGFHPVRLDPLAEQVVEVAAPARPKTVRMETGLDDRGRLVLGDETQLFQLMLNLALNSFEALGEQGGTVRLTTRAEDGHVSLRVADNGPGIPEELKDRIFDPFFTTKGSGKGLGLGLAIVREIVEAHGGSITVDSAEGQGTAFTVLLPTVPPVPGADEPD